LVFVTSSIQKSNSRLKVINQ